MDERNSTMNGGMEMPEKCQVFRDNEWLEAEYIGVFQYSTVIDPSPMVGGHKGGVIAYPVVVVKLNNKIYECSTTKVKFDVS